MYYDVDWSFVNSHLTDNDIAEYIDPNGHSHHDLFDTWLICGLMENEGFKQQFIERFAYHINVTFAPQRVVERIDEIAGTIDSEMPLDRETWNARFEDTPGWYKQALGSSSARAMSYDSWKRNVDRLRSFAQSRPDIVKEQLKNFFGLSDSDMVRLGLKSDN